jgi:hypothetical protein
MKRLLLATAALSIMSVPALAAPCRDGKGKFVKCPKPAGGAIRCKDAKGKFAKCGMPGTHTVS